jgi:GntR family transcriptional regulator, N-acetylglucosamine utilization regulator
VPVASRRRSGSSKTRWTDATISEETGVPLYLQIRNLLRERIRLGEWSAEEPMPTEEDLVAHFGVSRTTVRQAMSDLANEGLVVRRPGRGTFARQPLMVLRMQQWHSLTKDIAQRGSTPSKKILRVERLKAGAEIADRAKELVEGEMLHIQSIRYADDVPIIVLDQYYPYELCGFLADVPLDDPNLTSEGILAEHGIVEMRADGEIIATTASTLEAKYLDVEPGSPLIEIATKAYSADGRVVEYARGVVVTASYPLALYSDWSTEGVAAPPRLSHGRSEPNPLEEGT